MSIRKYINIVEADVIDFSKKQKEKEMAKAPKAPDSLKYAAAVKAQSKEEPKTLGDVARNIILKNIDKIFSGEQLPDEDREQLNNILYVDHAMKATVIHGIIRNSIEIHNKNNPTNKISWGMPNKKEAYLKDSPTLGFYRVEFNGVEKTFSRKEEFYVYILKNVFVKELDSWTDDEKKRVADYIENITSNNNWEKYSEKEKEFNPDVPERHWADSNERDNALIPSLEKFLDKFRNGENGFIWYTYYDGFRITFAENNMPNKVKTFNNIEEMEKWISENKGKIQAWYDRHQKIDRSETSQLRILKRLTNLTVKLCNNFANGADPEAIIVKANEVNDWLDYVATTPATKEIKHILWSYLHNLRNPEFRHFIDAETGENLQDLINKHLSK